ncbi:hypothetical protein LOK49_LG11G00207 [Camellia lanceoleosa]|uniref:Uncharacterized protein n=1 Tax=Camellia lanceoleosa TaxID=1840588 RepID=A0ACC0G370_9ERIC|nr:hypothetical protein LOK49_LG11G00207 [Camellia lanceoleosa]
MFPVRKEVGPCRRILFLGGRSFEFEESDGADGKCGLSIVERRGGVTTGGGAECFGSSLVGGQDEVRGEEGGGTSFQIVVTIGQRREEVYILVSAFGYGWEGVALVVDGFGLCVAKASRPIGFRKVSSTSAAECESVGVVRSEVEVDWFRILDRSLVGKLGGLGGKGLSFATISDWVAWWWKHSGKMDVRPLGDKAFLFVLSSRGEAEALLRRQWIVEGCDLLLEWWSPLALCTPAKTLRPKKSVWIQLMGLPIYLRGEAVFRFISDCCGGFIEADKSSVDLGSIRICVQCSEFTPSRVSFRWGMWQFSLPVWVEDDPMVELWTSATVKDGDSAPNMVTTDFGQLGQDFQPRMGVNEYLQRFRREERPMGFQGTFTQRVGPALGHPRGPKEGQLGWRQAQVFGNEEVGQCRWAVVKNKGTHLGAQVGNGGRTVAY